MLLVNVLHILISNWVHDSLLSDPYTLLINWHGLLFTTILTAIGTR